MTNGWYFFLVFLCTILFVRTFLYVRPTSAPTIFGFRTHHYMYGLILIPIGIYLKNTAIFAIGLGLFVDELGYLIIRGNTHQDNYSPASLAILVLVIGVIFALRKQILFWL